MDLAGRGSCVLEDWPDLSVQPNAKCASELQLDWLQEAKHILRTSTWGYAIFCINKEVFMEAQPTEETALECFFRCS